MRIVYLTMVDPFSRPDGGTQRVRAFVELLSELRQDVRCVYPVWPTDGGAAPADERYVPVAARTLGRAAWPSVVRKVKRHLFPVPLRASFSSPVIQRHLLALRPVDVLVVDEVHAAQYAGCGGSRTRSSRRATLPPPPPALLHGEPGSLVP